MTKSYRLDEDTLSASGRSGPPTRGAEQESAAHGQGDRPGSPWAPAYGLGADRSGPFVQGRDLQPKSVQEQAMGPTKGLSYGGVTRQDDYSATDWQDNRARQATHESVRSGPHFATALPSEDRMPRPEAHPSRPTRDPSTYRYERDPSGWWARSPRMTGAHFSFGGILRGRAQVPAQAGTRTSLNREINSYEDPSAGLDNTEFASTPPVTLSTYAGKSYRLNG